MNIYYVYQYLREDQTPYYIGKGKANRINEGHRLPLPITERRVMIAENLSEQAAFDLEIELIAKYGRKDLGTGILRNQTDGGDGTSGSIRTEEFKQAQSKRMKQSNAKRKQEGWKYPDSASQIHRERQLGVPKPKEWVRQCSSSIKQSY